MSTNRELLGTATDADGDEIEVYHDKDEGKIVIESQDGFGATTMWYTEPQMAYLVELLIHAHDTLKEEMQHG